MLRRRSISDADGFLVFVGMNDDLPANATVSNILIILDSLSRVSSRDVVTFLALPFCVNDFITRCKDRAVAASILSENVSFGKNVHIIDAHLTKRYFLRSRFETNKKNSTAVDPLHLNLAGYRHVAEVVNDLAVLKTASVRRRPKPKRVLDL